MNSSKQIWDSKSILLWIAVILVACLIYTTGISHESIWYDEAYSAVMSEYLPGQIITFATFDNHPPLYHLLLSIAQGVSGNSEWALRVLSVVGAVALVSLGAGPVQRIFGG